MDWGWLHGSSRRRPEGPTAESGSGRGERSGQGHSLHRQVEWCHRTCFTIVTHQMMWDCIAAKTACVHSLLCFLMDALFIYVSVCWIAGPGLLSFRIMTSSWVGNSCSKFTSSLGSTSKAQCLTPCLKCAQRGSERKLLPCLCRGNIEPVILVEHREQKIAMQCLCCCKNPHFSIAVVINIQPKKILKKACV